MGAQTARPNINEAQYEAHFKSTSRNCQTGPEQDRSCQDVCCLVTFILLTLIFIAGGVYFIATFKSSNLQAFKINWNNSTTNNATINGSTKHELFEAAQVHNQVGLGSGLASNNELPNFSSAIPKIFIMGMFSLILSIVLVIAISKIPKVVVFGTIGLTFLLIAGGILGGLMLGEPKISMIFGIFGLIWMVLVVLMFCCWRDQFNAAIVLLKVTGEFLRHKPSVLTAPLLVMFISFFYFVFWLISFVAIQTNRNYETLNTNQHHSFDIYDGLTLVWVFLSIFYSYFLYYVMVFLIATATAMWYYNMDGNFITKGFSYIFNAHIGSLTFASMLVTIVNMLKNSAQNNNNQNQNSMCMVCLCIVRCCLSFIEELIKVLNNNAVIVMSFSGQGFIQSAKTAIYMIYNYFGIFISVEMVDFLLNICVFFLTIVLPTGLGFVFLKLTYNQAANQEQTYLITGTLIIFVVCVLISALTVTILSQVLSCVFIFFCLHQKFRRLNYGSVNRVPSEMQELFEQIQQQGGEQNNDFSGNYNNRNYRNNNYNGPYNSQPYNGCKGWNQNY